MDKFLMELLGFCSASGDEAAVRDFVKDRISGFCDGVETDSMGNLTAFKKGARPERRLMITAQLDETGFVVTHVEKNGFARIGKLGGAPVSELAGQIVDIGGRRGVLRADAAADPSALKTTDLYVDMGGDAKIEVGAFGTIAANFAFSGGRIIGKGLHARFGCYAAAEAARLSRPVYDSYFVFTAQSGVGQRGAAPAAARINPDFCVSVGACAADDVPGGKGGVKLGGGAAIKLLDKSLICDGFVVEKLKAAAAKAAIKCQFEVGEKDGCDAGAVQFSGEGVRCGGVSIPTRYLFSPAEIVELADADCAKNLLIEFLETEDKA